MLKFDFIGDITWHGTEWGKWYPRPRKRIEQGCGIWNRWVYLNNNEQILLNIVYYSCLEKQREIKLASWLNGKLRPGGRLEHSVNINSPAKHMSSVGFQRASQCWNYHRVGDGGVDIFLMFIFVVFLCLPWGHGSQPGLPPAVIFHQNVSNKMRMVISVPCQIFKV